ncbi:hypothetical protein T484DRAFT_1960555 [Baffinella frigidus]|nr:hypothetical protein T484DRAFT_1960555 [Cryptophyta sp. CCMP2293]
MSAAAKRPGLSLYRLLLRSAKLMDRRPALKGLIQTQRMRFYDRKNSEWIEMDAQDKEDASLLGHIAKLTGGGRFYLPEASAVGVVRDAFKEGKALTGEELDGEMDVAIAAIRMLDANIGKGRKLGVLDWERAAPTRPPPYAIQEAPRNDVSVGRLLLAHPMLNQAGLTRAVILLVQHNRQGTFGIVLNRRVPFTMGDLLREHEQHETKGLGMSSKVRDSLEPFSENVLFKGGDVSLEFLSILHPYADLKGSQAIGGGLYWQCDLREAGKMVQQGKASADQFKFFLGHARWGPSQLSGEVEMNLWRVAAPSQAKETLEPDARNGADAGRKGEGEGAAAGVDEAKGADGVKELQSVSKLVFNWGNAEGIKDDPVFQDMGVYLGDARTSSQVMDDKATEVWREAWVSLIGRESEELARLPVPSD